MFGKIFETDDCLIFIRFHLWSFGGRQGSWRMLRLEKQLSKLQWRWGGCFNVHSAIAEPTTWGGVSDLRKSGMISGKRLDFVSRAGRGLTSLRCTATPQSLGGRGNVGKLRGNEFHWSWKGWPFAVGSVQRAIILGGGLCAFEYAHWSDLLLKLCVCLKVIEIKNTNSVQIRILK